ncbi:MAG: shikimate dehydrogenase [Acidimicrobiales bacterium]
MVGVIGAPVRHSLSPRLHNAAFAALGLDWAYLAFPVAPDQVGAALAAVLALGLAGLNVTMPHKAAVVPLCDRISPTVEALGAANTLVARDGELAAESTDGPGFLDALRTGHGFRPEGRRALVVGAGGAARAVILALAGAGASEVVVVNRTRARAEAAAALAGTAGRVGEPAEADGADLVVNATPLGMDLRSPPPGVLDRASVPASRPRHAGPPRPEHAGPPGPEHAGPPRPDHAGPPGPESPFPADPVLPVPADRLGPGQLVVDLVYHPPCTPFLEAAAARGAVTANGVGMLVHQAARSFSLWTGLDPPVEAMLRAARLL